MGDLHVVASVIATGAADVALSRVTGGEVLSNALVRDVVTSGGWLAGESYGVDDPAGLLAVELVRQMWAGEVEMPDAPAYA